MFYALTKASVATSVILHTPVFAFKFRIGEGYTEAIFRVSVIGPIKSKERHGSADSWCNISWELSFLAPHRGGFCI